MISHQRYNKDGAEFKSAKTTVSVCLRIARLGGPWCELLGFSRCDSVSPISKTHEWRFAGNHDILRLHPSVQYPAVSNYLEQSPGKREQSASVAHCATCRGVQQHDPQCHWQPRSEIDRKQWEYHVRDNTSLTKGLCGTRCAYPLMSTAPAKLPVQKFEHLQSWLTRVQARDVSASPASRHARLTLSSPS